MTIRYEDKQLVNLMSHKIIRTRWTPDKVIDRCDNPSTYSWKISCSTCNRDFEDGEDRHEWRMYLPAIDFAKYRNGSFITINCHECFVKTMFIWQRTIAEEIESMPQSMRDLVQ